MLKSLRWRVTLIFVALSAAICLVLASVAVFMLRAGLDSSIDQELDAIADEVESFVDLKEPGPELSQWQTTTRARSRLSATIQIFNRDHMLIGSYGPAKAMSLNANQEEVIVEREEQNNSFRVLCRPLREKNSKIAWLQICIPTRDRDLALKEYVVAWGLLTPVLLVGLGVAGYVFAGRVTRPVEKSFEILRTFLADASHELKTPVTIMQANAESLAADLSSRDIECSEVPVILRSCSRMTNLVEDLLLLSRIESPAIRTSREKVRIDQVVHDLVDEFKPLFAEKNILLSFDKVEPAEVAANLESIYRALSNLLKNALLYTESGGAVTVEIVRSKTRTEVEIAITDTGIGIPSEALDKIFDRFYRVEKSRSRKAGGFGLGLSIVRGVVEQHGGKLFVTSTLNKGSTFRMVLPAA